MRILAFICLLVLSGLTGLYSQDTGDVQVKSGYVKVPEGSLYYEEAGTGAVSYTHLTLPTTPYV